MPSQLTDTVLAELKAKHGELHELTAPTGEAVVVKVPSPAQYRRFRVQAQDERKRDVAVENLVRDAMVHPEPAEFTAMVDRRPGLTDAFGAVLIELAGLSRDVEKKAL